MKPEVMIALIKRLLKRRENKRIINLVKKANEEDLLGLIRQMDTKTRSKFLSTLSPELLGKIIVKLPDRIQAEFMHSADTKKISDLLQILSPDVAADLLGMLPEKKKISVMRKLPKEKEEELSFLLKYPKDTAGGLMTTEFVALNENLTIKNAIKQVREKTKKYLIHYVYVTDNSDRLVGVVSLKKLAISDPRNKLKDIAVKKVVKVSPRTDQEKVVTLFTKYDLVTLPVVDELGRIIGIVTVDDVMDVMEDRVSEYIGHMSGSIESIDKVIVSPSLSSVKARIPWLLFTVIGEIIFTGKIISLFQNTLTAAISLSFFIPVLMCLSGDVGMQSSTVVVRGMATGELAKIEKFILKEVKVGGLMAIIFGFLTGISAYLWISKPSIGFIVGLAIFLSILISNLTGIFLPILFKKLGFDPAVSAGPFITTILDAISVATYFLVAIGIFSIF